MSKKALWDWNGLDKGLIILDKARIPKGASRFFKNVRIRPDGSLVKRGGSTYFLNEAIERFENTSVNGASLGLYYDGNIYLIDNTSRKVVKYNGSEWSLYRYGYNTWEFINNVGGGRDNTVDNTHLVILNKDGYGIEIPEALTYIRDAFSSTAPNHAVGWSSTKLYLYDPANDTLVSKSFSDWSISNVIKCFANYNASKYTVLILTGTTLYIKQYDTSTSTWSDITYFDLSGTLASMVDTAISDLGGTVYYWVVGYDSSNNRKVWVYDTSTSTSSVFDVSTDIQAPDLCYAYQDKIAIKEQWGVFIYDTAGTKQYEVEADTNKETLSTIDFVADNGEVIQHTEKLIVKQTSTAEIIADYFEDTTDARLVRCLKGWALLRDGQRPMLYNEYGLFPLSLEEKPSVISYTSGGTDKVKVRLELSVLDSDSEEVLSIKGEWVDVGDDVNNSYPITVRIPENIVLPEDVASGYTLKLYLRPIIYNASDGEWRYCWVDPLYEVKPGEKVAINTALKGSYISTNGILPPDDIALHVAVGEAHLGRLVLAKGNKIYWSDTDNSMFDYTYWWLEVGDKSDIIGLVSWRGNLYIFKENGEIWILRGEFPVFAPDSSGTREALNMTLERVTGSAGRVFPHSIKANERGIFFANRDNMYIFNGYVVSPISIGLTDLLSNLEDGEAHGGFYTDEYGEYYVLSVADKMSEPEIGDY